jgi:hypothetical protein
VYDLERDNLRRPESPGSAPRSKSSLLPVVLVIVPLGILVLGAVAFAGRAGLLMLAVVAAIPAFVAAHYLLWGRWLMRSLRDTQDDED